MGDIHGIAARKLEILTEKPVTQPILRATFAQHGYAFQKSPRFWRKTGGLEHYMFSERLQDSIPPLLHNLQGIP